MNFEKIISQFRLFLDEKNQTKIDILSNIYIASSFETTPLQTQYEEIEKLIQEFRSDVPLSLKLVKIHILGKLCL